MSVESARAKAEAVLDDYPCRECDLGDENEAWVVRRTAGLDELIREVKASLPCFDAWAEVHRRDGAEEEYDLLAFCPTDCRCPCISCQARAEKVEAT